MPTYDYECDACNHTFEMFQSITAKPIRKCPRCGKTKVRRLIGTGAGIIFKGSGFYQTDYRSASYRQAAEKDKAPSSSSSTAGAGDTKAASSDKGPASDKGSAAPSGSADKPAPKSEPKSESKPAAKSKK